ncbi:hypothetical protein Ccrd_023471 [Cynara cardunculus var. scolymus]|uniref:Transcription factor MYC/MYB N-terminal domain-containing protein n=1 Tax=Cynara cardunculus var. scolymus TaxID=59895 RepID=A0A103XWT8_CYNCS|nr:hypothetical protein Ccrd_023471 [Cynara cardunculus var. scolymus]
MEAGLPMLTCLIQHTLKNLCTCSSSDSSSSDPKWVYAVYWRISPRIYPPPKWDYEGGVLDRAKGNKRNWILVWDDGFCDLDECERVGNHGFLKSRFGADVFFKLSHEVYNYGEGLIGKVAADNSHRWTIAIISVREGIIQLGSFDKVLEDLNLVISIQRKFSYLRSIPGLFSIQRPFSTIQHLYNPLKHKGVIGGNVIGSDEAQQVIGSKVNIRGGESQLHKGPILSFGSGYNIQEIGRTGSHGPPLWPIPPLLPSNFESQLDKMPSYNDPIRIRNDGISQVKDPDQERKHGCFDPNQNLVVELGFGPKRIAQESDVKSQLS